MTLRAGVAPCEAISAAVRPSGRIRQATPTLVFWEGQGGPLEIAAANGTTSNASAAGLGSSDAGLGSAFSAVKADPLRSGGIKHPIDRFVAAVHELGDVLDRKRWMPSLDTP